MILRKTFWLMNNAVFGKTMEDRDIKLLTTNRRRNYSVPTKLSYNKMVFRKFNSNRNEKNKSTNEYKSVYLGLSILEISKTLMVLILL